MSRFDAVEQGFEALRALEEGVYDLTEVSRSVAEQLADAVIELLREVAMRDPIVADMLDEYLEEVHSE